MEQGLLLLKGMTQQQEKSYLTIHIRSQSLFWIYIVKHFRQGS